MKTAFLCTFHLVFILMCCFKMEVVIPKYQDISPIAWKSNRFCGLGSLYLYSKPGVLLVEAAVDTIALLRISAQAGSWISCHWLAPASTCSDGWRCQSTGTKIGWKNLSDVGSYIVDNLDLYSNFLMSQVGYLLKRDNVKIEVKADKSMLIKQNCKRNYSVWFMLWVIWWTESSVQQVFLMILYLKIHDFFKYLKQQRWFY